MLSWQSESGRTTRWLGSRSTRRCRTTPPRCSPDLVQLLLKVLLAEEYAGDDQPWDTDDMVYYPNDMAVSDHDAEEDGGDDNDVAVRGLEDEAQTMQH